MANPAAAQVDQQRAEAYFKEAATICQRDGGRLWGISLCGPMVVADARTRTFATNQPRPTEEPPRSLGFGNAPIEWGGIRWAAYMWDFTTLLDSRTRRILMLHELFHRIQNELGLNVAGGPARREMSIWTHSRGEFGCGSSGGRWRGRSLSLVRSVSAR